jgi:hypothetical protein
LRKSSAEDATAMMALAMPETMPLMEAASATMQTNSGAGLGMGTTCRSTRKASTAVAVVRAGPEIARQFTCMPVLATCRE